MKASSKTKERSGAPRKARPTRRSVSAAILRFADEFMLKPGEKDWNAFISYAHDDTKLPGQDWTAWVRDNLVNFETPRDLVGTTGILGDPVPASMPNVFIDTEPLPRSGKLTPLLEDHLGRSRVLVVLCSRKAATSEHIADEIACFKRIGREKKHADNDTAKRIIVLILDGERYSDQDKANECYPPTLAYDLQDDGRAPDLEKPAHPLFIDLRPTDPKGEPTRHRGATTPEAYERILREEGVYNDSTIDLLVRAYTAQLIDARIMLLSSALGLNKSELSNRENLRIAEQARQREEEAAGRMKAELRRARFAIGLASVFVVLAGCLVFFITQAQKARSEAERLRVIAEKQTSIVETEKANSERAASEARTAQKSAERAASEARTAQKNSEVAKQEAESQRARADEQRRKAESSAEEAKKAKDIAEASLQKLNETLDGLSNLSDWKGAAAPEAIQAINDYLREYYRKNPPSVDDFEGWSRFGTVLKHHGDLLFGDANTPSPDSARRFLGKKDFEEALDAYENHAGKIRPDDASLQHAWGAAQARLAGVIFVEAKDIGNTKEEREKLWRKSADLYTLAHDHFEGAASLSNRKIPAYLYSREVSSTWIGSCLQSLAELHAGDLQTWKKDMVAAKSKFALSQTESDECLQIFQNDRDFTSLIEKDKAANHKLENDVDALIRSNDK